MTTTLHRRDIDEQATLAALPIQLQLNEATPEPVQDAPDPVDREALKRDVLCHLDAIGLNGDQSNAVLDKSSIRTIHHVHRKRRASASAAHWAKNLTRSWTRLRTVTRSIQRKSALS